MLTAKEAIKRLEEGNKKYLTESIGIGDVLSLPARTQGLFRRVFLRRGLENCL